MKIDYAIKNIHGQIIIFVKSRNHENIFDYKRKWNYGNNILLFISFIGFQAGGHTKEKQDLK